MFSLTEKLARSVVPLSKFEAIAHICKSAPDTGAIIEIGVWRGGVALHLLDLFPGRQIYLADTFKGIPYSNPQYDTVKVGDFGGISAQDISRLFSPYKNVKILEGIFPDQFRALLDKETFAVVHLDVDVYQGYKDGLEFLYPRTVRNGIIFLDDYADIDCGGATAATDEFLATHNEELQLCNGQIFIIKE